MGNLFSYVYKRDLGLKDSTIFMMGLDGVGKTVILYRIITSKVVPTIPTLGCNVETIEHDNFRLTIWDMGSRDRIQLSSRYYMEGTVIIFVVDSTDRERIAEARDELLRLLGEIQRSDIYVLILANKQDLPDAMNALEISQHFNLHLHVQLVKDWYIQETSAVTGEGLKDGLNWISEKLNNKRIR